MGGGKPHRSSAEAAVGLIEHGHEPGRARIYAREQVALMGVSVNQVQETHTGFLVAVALSIHRSHQSLGQRQHLAGV